MSSVVLMASPRLAPQYVQSIESQSPWTLHRVHPFPHPVSCIEIQLRKGWQYCGVQVSSFIRKWEEISRQITSSAVQRKSSPVCFCLCAAGSLFPTQSFGEGDYRQEVTHVMIWGYEYAEGTWIVDTLSPDHV
eukprot:TRINITY_DN2413_c0_g1_i1.p1 TRINITY_DN2413_c0_g1~~TRINITY_DN2413_c0_g1_i1.p1  ORF type:complete len:133 (-),score=15.55 TRINITY_DN2413_c0_g1_i1:1010-1408(-)